MATSAAPTAAAKQRRRQQQGQRCWAGAREAEGAPCVFSVSLSAARPGTPVPVLLVVAASAPAARGLAAPRAKREPDPRAERNLPEWRSPALPPLLGGGRSRSGGRGPSPVLPPPAVGGGLEAGRPGPPSRARSPSAAPSAAEPPPPLPASKFGSFVPGAPRDRGAFVSSWIPRAPLGGDPREQCRGM